MLRKLGYSEKENAIAKNNNNNKKKLADTMETINVFMPPI